MLETTRIKYFTNFLFSAKDFLWSWPLLLLLLGTGVYLTIYLKGFQFRYFFKSFKLYGSANKSGVGDISSYQALMTALAGAIGTGNIAGIATAVALGGLGALFWMWVVAFFGMATSYAETVLGVKYKQINSDGEIAGGPMYTLKFGLNAKTLSLLFAIFGIVSSFGFCLVQSNSVIDAVVDIYAANRLISGVILAFIAALVIIGGVKSIGRVAGVLVPFMALGYLIIGLYILAINYMNIIPAFKLIVTSAFTGQSAVGGFLGSTIIMAMQNGAQYGIFANEAGLGSFSIAGSSSQNKYPTEQGMLSITGVFISTMIVCTITGLVLAVTNVLGVTTINGKLLMGSPLALQAFGSIHFGFRHMVLVGLTLFAFTTILAWAYYGEKCVEFIFGTKMAHFYRWLYIFIIVIGALLELELVWAFAHLANGLMAIPNLYSLILLSPVVKRETTNYLAESVH